MACEIAVETVESTPRCVFFWASLFCFEWVNLQGCRGQDFLGDARVEGDAGSLSPPHQRQLFPPEPTTPFSLKM